MKQYKKIVIAILLLATMVRIVYIAKVPILEKQHDIITYGNGHLNYIIEIYNQETLPDNNEGQRYHPPLHYMISALWLKGVSKLVSDQNILLESLQILPMLYSVLLLFVIIRILDKLEIPEKYKILVLLLMAFHPTFLILSGSVNNDMLSIFLIFTVILGLLHWYQKSNVRNTVILALITGLSVMTKMSAAIMSVPIIYVFLLKFYEEYRKTTNKKEVVKRFVVLYFLFGVISLPIGLWYPIRNLIEFGQPILYVLDIEDPAQYVGSYTWLKRLLPSVQELSRIRCNPFRDYSIPVYILKSSLFGEFNWNSNIFIKYGLIVLNLILIVISCENMIGNTIKMRKDKKHRTPSI